MRELALFAGCGGGILGGKLFGWRTVCAVEIEPYCQDVLLARQRDGALDRFPIWNDVRTFDGRPWRGAVDIVTGGFPCQDLSPAGPRAGLDGERSGLWWEMHRIIGEVRPRFALIENSGHRWRAWVPDVRRALWDIGYASVPFLVRASDAGAWHERRRAFVVAYQNPIGVGRATRGVSCSCAETRESFIAGSGAEAADIDCSWELQREGREPDERGWVRDRAEETADAAPLGCRENRLTLRREGRPSTRGCGSESADAHRAGLAFGPCVSLNDGTECAPVERDADGSESGGWWDAEPGMVRMAHGLPHRVDRVRGLGNAQVPAMVPLVWRAFRKWRLTHADQSL